MANGTLSNYFEQDRVKAAKKAGGDSVYSAPAGDAAGTAPMGGGPSAPSAPSAPKGSAGGGTGFVSFGQYFGANAPAIQQQAQQFVQPGSVQRQARAGGASPKEDPYAAQIAQTSARFAELNPAAQSGDMGKGVSAFDQLLGGGVTQRAAKQEQERLGTLRSALEGEQAQWQRAEERNKQLQEQTAQKKAQEQEQAQRTQDAALVSAKDLAYREADSAGVIQMFHSRDSWWNSLSDAEKQKYLDQTTTGRGTGQFGESEYGSVSQ